MKNGLNFRRTVMRLSLNSEVEVGFMEICGSIFGLRLRVRYATSAKLGGRKLRRFPAAGCVAAGRPRKRTNAGPSGGRRGRAERHTGTPGRAVWPAGDSW